VARWADEIVGEIALGDARREERLRVLIETLAEQGGRPIPQACETWAATNAAYRFFDNAHVDPAVISQSLARATAARCQGEELVLGVQDTTSFDYSTHQKTVGLGPLESPTRRGLFVHTTLAVSTKGVPLGVLDRQVWARDPEDVGKRHRRKELPIEAKESAKWLHGLANTAGYLGPEQRMLVVADREADVYELFALAHELKVDWLIRARHDRKLAGAEGQLLAAVAGMPPCLCTTVEVAGADKRPGRQARLEVRRATVVLVPPKREQGVDAHWWQAHPQTERLAPRPLEPVRVGVVLATEIDPPAVGEPVRWLLLTSLPVETTEQVLTCIGYYSLRWLVERYHFVLKSGCQVERLQLETAQRLERALAVYAGVAWRLLWLTHEARVQPQRPCTVVLDDDAWRLLWVLTAGPQPLPASPPDLRTAIRQIAQLGGFLGRKHDGEPGVKTLWRGLSRLSDMVLTYRALKEHPDLLSNG
jgi:hypothetical protein